MGAFRDLMQEAVDQGMTRLRFEVDLPKYFSPDQADSWLCASGESPHARGRTGEEALRVLVEQVKR